MNPDKYFYENGAIQRYTGNGPERIIECETSALDAKKIPQDLAIKIVHALNYFDSGYVPMDSDMEEVEKHATQMEYNSVYGGGIIMGMLHSCRMLKDLRERASNGQL